jgi:hypothetical protein
LEFLKDTYFPSDQNGVIQHSEKIQRRISEILK